MKQFALLINACLIIVMTFPALGQDTLITNEHEKIIFPSLRPGNWDIYYFETAGAAPRRLTAHPGLDYDAVLSPDGRWVVFTSERRGHPDLYALDLQTENAQPRLLIDDIAMEDQAAISPDGKTLAFVSTHDMTTDIYVIPFLPGKTQGLADATNLTRHAGGDFRPAFSPDGKQIAFSSDRDSVPTGHPVFPFSRQREGELYVMDADGNNLKRLTDSADWDGSPVWSDDGDTIYFYSGRNRTPKKPEGPHFLQESGYRIWAMNPDGSDPRPVTDEGVEAMSPTIMADGRVAFTTRDSYGDWYIASVKPDGSGLRPESDRSTVYWTPSSNPGSRTFVSHGRGPGPDGTLALEPLLGPGPLLGTGFPAMVAIPDQALELLPIRHTSGLAPHPFKDEIIITHEDTEGSIVVRADYRETWKKELLSVPGLGIVSGNPSRIFGIKWSYGGDRITYSQGVFNGDTRADVTIWTMRSDASERIKLSPASNINEGESAFSPDGKELVFRSSRDGQVDLYLMNVDGSNLRRLTYDAHKENFPVFSPLGNEISFASDRDGDTDPIGFRDFEIYTMQLLPGGRPGKQRRITHNPGNDAHPYYSPDGRWLVYTSEKGGVSDEEPLVQEVSFGPQMYGEIFAYRLRDGYSIRLTHNKWEEGNPFWVRFN